MPAITVKNIPERLYSQLKAAAKLHRRSINNEIIACLEKDLQAARARPETRIRRAREIRRGIGRDRIDARQIRRAITQGRP